MSVQPSAFVLEHAPWSYSKAETAAQCPYRFYLTYVQKRKRGKPNADALVGQAVHTILEFMASGRNWNLAYDAARESYPDLTSNEIDRIEEMKFAAQNFVGKLERYQKRHNVQDTWIERKLGVDINGNPTKFFGHGVFFRGVVDLALFPKRSGHVIVLDHKTGKRRSLHYYEKQFDCYLLLARANLKHLSKGRVGIHWAKDDIIELSKKVRNITDIQPYQEQLMTWLNDAVKETATNFKKTKRGPLCPWCDHQAICPEFSQGSDTDNASGKDEEG